MGHSRLGHGCEKAPNWTLVQSPRPLFLQQSEPWGIAISRRAGLGYSGKFANLGQFGGPWVTLKVRNFNAK